MKRKSMKTLSRLFLFLAALPLACNSDASIAIFMLGDSTMADKPNPESNPERGWGQVLPRFFNEHVAVKNFAVNGRSTKSFIDEGRWEVVRKQLTPGDYVFIQFGHNDTKATDPKRYTNPHTGYRRNLLKFVREARERGALPILFSPIVRRNFNEAGTLEDTHGAYPLVMRTLAHEMNVPFIDLQLKSEELVLSLGPENSKALYLWLAPGKYAMYPEGKQDNTHFTETGAMAMAKLAVAGLCEQNSALINFMKRGQQ